jgi:hypothetical protein
VSREQITAPGKPWGYWREEQIRQKVLSKISDAGDDASYSDRFRQKFFVVNIWAKNLPIH